MIPNIWSVIDLRFRRVHLPSSPVNNRVRQRPWTVDACQKSSYSKNGKMSVKRRELIIFRFLFSSFKNSHINIRNNNESSNQSSQTTNTEIETCYNVTWVVSKDQVYKVPVETLDKVWLIARMKRYLCTHNKKWNNI